MPSKQLGTTWPAPPHTLAKIAIFKSYLKAYFPILGRTRPNQAILIVDGFAGPGEYENSDEGSPIAALRAAAEAVGNLGPAWAAGDLYCAFIESDNARCANLRKCVQQVPAASNVKPIVLQKTFVEGIAELRQTIPRPFTSNEPLFVFIDPFGATGVPFSKVEEILRSPCSEVLINLDADGIARVFRAGDDANRDDILTSIYGDESWRIGLDVASNFSMLCRQVLELYKAKLRSINRVKYAFSFEMRGSKDSLNYHLVFASQHSLGLEKMKEAMRSIDKTGGYSFSDGHVNQATLFRFDHPEDFAAKLHMQFRGKAVPYAPVNDFALNETPFTNPIAMLKTLLQTAQVEVARTNPKHRGLSAKHVSSIRFLDRAPKTISQKKESPGGLFDGN